MVARQIRTFLARILQNAARILQGVGAAFLPEDAPQPPQRPGDRAADERDDLPPVYVPPDARAMIHGAAEHEEETPPEPLAGSIAARRKQARS